MNQDHTFIHGSGGLFSVHDIHLQSIVSRIQTFFLLITIPIFKALNAIYINGLEELSLVTCQMLFMCTHIYREGNQVADILACFGAESYTYYRWSTIPFCSLCSCS